MAMHLITGHSGTAHISAADDGALNAAIVGEGSYVFGFGDDFAATMTTANSVTIGTGALVHQGRKAWCSTSTQLTVESGTQAQRRHDLVVARYTKTGDVEDMQLAVVKGTPVSYGDPSDPEHEDGSVIDGATVSDFPLWRIPIDGITPGTPVRLFDVTPSLAELRDSVSQQPRVFIGSKVINVVAGKNDHWVYVNPFLSHADLTEIIGTSFDPGAHGVSCWNADWASSQVILVPWCRLGAASSVGIALTVPTGQTDREGDTLYVRVGYMITVP